MTEKISQIDNEKSISTISKQQIGMINETDKTDYFDYRFADLANMQKQGIIENSSTTTTQGKN